MTTFAPAGHTSPGRAAVIATARAWLGTPYHHQMSVRGVGCDCLGVVRGVWRELYGTEPAPMPAYARDWAEAGGEETLLAAARRHFTEVVPAQAAPGDVLVFRYRLGSAAKHMAVLTGSSTMLHACEGGPVCEVALTPWWRRRIAACFAYPGVDD